MISQLEFNEKNENRFVAKVNYGQYVIRFFGSIPSVAFYFGNDVKHCWCKKIQPDYLPDWHHTKAEYLDKAFNACQERHEWFVDLVAQNKGE